MSRISRLAATMFALIVTLFSAPAFADEPPPECYEETCTLDAITASGGNCTSCLAGPVVDEQCAASSMGFELVCSTRGASSYTQVWCEPDSGFTPPADPNAACNGSDDDDSGCHVSPAGTGGDVGVMLLLSAFGVLVVRRYGRS